MLKVVLFALGNLAAGWLLSSALASQVHYPGDIPVRLQPQAAALVMAAVFSLVGAPIARLRLKLRTLLVVLSMPLSIAGAGAVLFGLDRAAGALIALTVAYQSPLALASGAGWGLVWSFLVFPPVLPAPPAPVAREREELPVSDNWSGVER